MEKGRLRAVSRAPHQLMNFRVIGLSPSTIRA